jgi:hypothetical protein
MIPVFQAIHSERPAPIVITNLLPHIKMHIGTRGGHPDSDQFIYFLPAMIDSCAGMSLGLKSWHLGIAQRYPQIVKEVITFSQSQYRTIPISGVSSDTGEHSITVNTIIEYWTPWTLQGLQISMKIGLADLVASNTILGLPFLIAAKCTQIFDKNTIFSAAFGEQFDVSLSRPSTDPNTALQVSVNTAFPRQIGSSTQDKLVQIAGAPAGNL